MSTSLWRTRATARGFAEDIRMRRILSRLAGERGDVPGWVLITLMTAGLVIVIWGLAGPALSAIFQNAIAKVTGL